VTLVRKQTMPTEWPPLVGEVIVPTFADRGCRVVSATDPHGRLQFNKMCEIFVKWFMGCMGKGVYGLTYIKLYYQSVWQKTWNIPLLMVQVHKISAVYGRHGKIHLWPYEKQPLLRISMVKKLSCLATISEDLL
jgi:hypothetical protein